MSIYENWTPKEIDALRRALAKLRAAQPKHPIRRGTSEHPGIYWCNRSERFRVFILGGAGKRYCGMADTIEDALILQANHERRHCK